MHSFSLLPDLAPAACTAVGWEVYRGLTGRPKSLCPWLFYDAAGSELFEAITELPEYYVTRTERDILARHADGIVASASAGRRLTLIELGAGTAAKTGLLLKAAVRRQGSLMYQPIDVSPTALAQARERIEAEIPQVRVEPHVGDYTQGLDELPEPETSRLVLYIGSSIGNFEPSDAAALLRELRARFSPGDKLLLGVDMVKDRGTLLAAYDDRAGVTERFNKNVLTRINRELGANFNLRLFRHRARWNEEHARIEMHLESLIGQYVHLPALELDVRLKRGETIHTENSYKFTPASAGQMLGKSGFRVLDCWTDPQQWFSVYLAGV